MEGGCRVYQEVALDPVIEEARDARRYRLEPEGFGVERRLISREAHAEPYLLRPPQGFSKAL